MKTQMRNKKALLIYGISRSSNLPIDIFN